MATGARVLVVDDDRDICETLRDILEIERYKVTTVGDGYGAIDLVARQPFDVVLLDIKMPGIDGFETHRRIRQITAELPVILVSAFAVGEAIQAALNDGVFAAMKKPVPIARLLETIEAALKAS